jgi:hypothetical protein
MAPGERGLPAPARDVTLAEDGVGAGLPTVVGGSRVRRR